MENFAGKEHTKRGKNKMSNKGRWEKEVEKICVGNNIWIDKKGYNKLEALGIDDYFKLFILPLKKLIELDEDDISFEVGPIKIYARKIKKKPIAGTLEELHTEYKKLLYIEDTRRIDVGLAVALSRKNRSVPLWLFFVGPSGDLKTEQLSALDDEDKVQYLSRITSKTLINGYKDKEKYPDLAPQLDNKLMIIKDMAPLLKLHPVEKGEVWAQLRELYDGSIGAASGMGMNVRYEDLYITLLAGSTPAIDGQILIHQDLGTRELIYRTTGSKLKKKLMEKCMDNEEYLERIRKRLKKITTEFIKNTKIKEKNIPQKVKDELMEIAMYISYMRATAEIDSYTNEVRTDVSVEEPTRLIMQLKRLFVCLMSLKENYAEKKALDIIWRIAKSSAFQTRKKVLTYLVNNEEQSTSQIAKALHMGKSVITRDLGILWNMGLVARRDVETNYPDKFYYYWQINETNPFVLKYSKYEKKREKLQEYIIEKPGEKA